MASAKTQNKSKQKTQQPGKKDIPPTKMTDNKKQKKQKKSNSNTNNSSGSSCCRWFIGSFVLIGAIGGLIAYDTNVLHNGNFEESSLGGVLKQTGALPHVENAWFVSLKYSARGFKWIEENAPIAYGKTKTILEPYGDFAKDLGISLINGGKKGFECTKVFVTEKIPIVLQFIDNYVPGAGQKISDFVSTTCKGFCSITSNFWRQSVDFFKTKVFIGQLSPENLGKAFNTTTQRVLGYYSSFHERVEFYANTA
ncbi:hypothetical protein PVAND_005582 [Polypedilum vanderplanki]|uniref:Uncharacterized protein n=1 Tax=Polypedilum vanderplanki TaxID=319348 RepID=A0A9J6C117_POLVA|nr:hypothetical protein PVAND_005582 [Polypedilum vanderplanki]